MGTKKVAGLWISGEKKNLKKKIIYFLHTNWVVIADLTRKKKDSFLDSDLKKK